MIFTFSQTHSGRKKSKLQLSVFISEIDEDEILCTVGPYGFDKSQNCFVSYHSHGNKITSLLVTLLEQALMAAVLLLLHSPGHHICEVVACDDIASVQVATL